MSYSVGYEAIKLLAQAKVEHSRGRLDRAVELLSQIIALGERDEEFTHQYPYREAHGELYRVYEAMGSNQEADVHYRKAVQLGINPDQLSKKV